MRQFPPQPVRVIIPEHPQPIQTKRLLLRPIQPSDDAADIFEFRSREDVAKWLWTGIPHTSIQETEETLRKKSFPTPDATGAVGRQFSFAMVRLDDPHGKVIGVVGVNSLLPAPSIGYGTHPDCWGKGYAGEAVAGLIDAWWRLERVSSRDDGSALSSEDREKLYAACDRMNRASVGVLMRNGFKIYAEEEVKGKLVAFFELEMPLL